MFYKTALPALFVLALVVIDQGVKALIVLGMDVGHYSEILPFLALYHVKNSGIAFSMLASFSDWGLIFLTIAVMVFVLYLWWQVRRQPFLYHCGYLLVLGGAVGNLIDRMRFHYVTDYILLFYGDWSFAVFNLADAFITIGAGLIILREIVGKRAGINLKA